MGIKEKIYRQFERTEGFLGKLVGRVMEKSNKKLAEWMMEHDACHQPKKCRQHVENNRLHIHCGTLQDLSYPDGYFDLVCGINIHFFWTLPVPELPVNAVYIAGIQ